MSAAAFVKPVYKFEHQLTLKFSKKATKIDKILTADLTSCSTCQIYGKDFINFCALLRNTNFNQPILYL